MRFLHSADWHLGRVHHGVSLLEDQAHILGEFVRLAADARPDAILLAGDIHDRSVPPAEAVRLLDLVLTELVRGLRIPVVMIAGNHDGPDRLAFGASLLDGAGLTVRGLAEAHPQPLVLHDAHGAVAIHALPYAEPAVVRAVMRGADETAGVSAIDSHHAALGAQLHAARAMQPAGARSVVVAHAFVLGGSESESERPLSVGASGAVGAALFDGFDYVALGHLHRPQQVGEARIQYSGSLLKYSFSEADHVKSVNLVELDAAGACSVERIALSPRRDLRIVEGPLDAILAAAAADPGRDDYILARLTDTGALLDAMGKLRGAYPNALAIERPEMAGGGAGRAAADHRRIRVQDLFASFHQEATGLPLDGDGAAALERIVARLEREERHA
ncbi:exonuclease SbcCD subunit D [Thauera linaloolentis]|uniref:Nuclease SbcCD subunit D n=1 Tax=Thauera linaloolentis (strain DSM 12138 / JCM 21573 / CCUG 41526 / CIP 105981 / IAM 15112 / NBRC 102519 / 47Lol) TaxID=1123367 RepID=N6Y439_THAL4|nr:exonuclease SbcCD subunit D [Thauera linaloolentis]ENO86360.1 exonuclease SbcD [Thauera linaloolentis 47Lol = DSM 12138]MCM8565062.1 exonuclease SbcCD subunit D [Thauera linaloolentis]